MPLITQTASTFSYLTGGVVEPPAPIIFPKDSIIPYYNVNISVIPSGWTLYTVGNGRYITGTTSSSLVGTTTSATSGQLDAVLSSSGAHTGSIAYTSAASASTGSNINNGTNGSAGAHTHSGSIICSVQPQKVSVALIRANNDVETLPANTIAFRRALTGNYGTRFLPNSSSSTAYFMPESVSGVITNASSGSTVSGSVSSFGSHRHHSNTNQYFINGRQTNRPLMDSGLHSHSISGALSQTIMSNTMILDAWFSATTRIAQTDVVVMYVGNPANLPAGWFLCNGSNGTVNMNSYYLGIGTDNWGTIKVSDAVATSITVGSIGQHSHISSAPAAGAGITGWHGSQSWDHTHTVTRTVTPFMGAKFFLYFIQYKG